MSSPLWTPEDEFFLLEELKRKQILLDPPCRAEITAERGTMIALQHVIEKLTAIVEAGEVVSFQNVLNEEPAAWDPASWPSAALICDMVSEGDALNQIPLEIDGHEVFSQDLDFALWEVGEDYGEAHVAVVAGHAPIANALAEAVRQLFWQNLDSSTILSLPLPLAYVPEPFRFAFAKSRLKCDIWQSDKSSDTSGSSGSDKRYQRNIHFRWKAPRIIGRLRRAPFAARFSSTVTG